jgi:hypothetical protein
MKDSVTTPAINPEHFEFLEEHLLRIIRAIGYVKRGSPEEHWSVDQIAEYARHSLKNYEAAKAAYAKIGDGK